MSPADVPGAVDLHAVRARRALDAIRLGITAGVPDRRTVRRAVRILRATTPTAARGATA